MAKLIDENDIVEPINKVLKPLGFKKRSKRFWYRVAKETCQKVHLYRWSYSPQYVLTFRLSVRRLKAEEHPQKGDFGMIVHFERLMKSRSDQLKLKQAFDRRESGMSKVERFHVIHEYFTTYGVPILERLENESEIEPIYNKEVRDKDAFSITLKTMKALGIKDHP